MINYIDISKINKSYKSNVVLKDFSFSTCRGSVVGILGNNGIGKTTLFKILIGMVNECSGEIYLGSSMLGATIESPKLRFNMTAIDNMKSYSILRNGTYDLGSIKKSLDNVELNSKDKIKNFSVGMKQRLALAKATYLEPEIIILDEPFNGLDPKGVYRIKELITKLNREINTTIFISSHIASIIGDMIDVLLILRNNNEVLKLVTNKSSEIVYYTINDENIINKIYSQITLVSDRDSKYYIFIGNENELIETLEKFQVSRMFLDDILKTKTVEVLENFVMKVMW